MENKAISLACRMDSERAINLTKKIFEFLVRKGEIVHLETRIAPKIFPHNFDLFYVLFLCFRSGWIADDYPRINYCTFSNI